MGELTGGRLLVESLRRAGVDQVFSVSGGPINAVYDACAETDVALRHVRSESAAGFMAEAHYRATKQAGVAVVTLGPGVTNTVTPCVTAGLAGIPMLVVGGQSPLAVADRGAGMTTDTMSVMTQVTKWAARVLDAERIPEYVAEAWRRAHAPTAGPVYLEIPADVMEDTVEPERGRSLVEAVSFTRPEPSRPSEADVRAVARILDESPRRLVLVGDDCYHSADGAEVDDFVRRHGVAFASLRLARGLVPDDHPQSIGPGYIPCNPVLARALAEADTVLLLGHYWEFDLEFGTGVGPNTTVVQVDPDAHRLGRNGRVDLGVHASAGGFLRDLAAAADSAAADAAWAAELAQEWGRHRAAARERASRTSDLHPVTLVEAVEAAAPPDAVFVTSHGNVDFWADETLRVRRPGAYLRAGQSGTLGAEIPYGVAAALSRREPAIVFVGDGGVGYAVAELDSAARYGADVLVLVADDEQWTAIALPQERKFGRATELGLEGRDWVSVAVGLGARGARAGTASEVTAAVRDLLSESGPALLHVPIAAVESPYMEHISR